MAEGQVRAWPGEAGRGVVPTAPPWDALTLALSQGERGPSSSSADAEDGVDLARDRQRADAVERAADAVVHRRVGHHHQLGDARLVVGFLLDARRDRDALVAQYLGDLREDPGL